MMKIDIKRWIEEQVSDILAECEIGFFLEILISSLVIGVIYHIIFPSTSISHYELFIGAILIMDFSITRIYSLWKEFYNTEYVADTDEEKHKMIVQCCVEAIISSMVHMLLIIACICLILLSSQI